ncbi:MAG: hypothetical protein ACYC0H_01865 [Solirubrobacteraceae bacterium]
MQRRDGATLLGTGATRPVFAALAAGLAALALGACGASSATSAGQSQNAKSLLQQTFAKGHPIRSGVLTFSLSAKPAGSSMFTTPISLTINGPFQSRGSGQVPESNFTLTVSGLGQSGSLGVISTGSSGYLTLAGTAYQLPAASFQKLQSSFSAVGGGGSQGGFTALGLDPMKWLVNPTVAGSDTVAGAATTHIHAGVDVAALLTGVNKLLAKAASTTSSATIPKSITPANQQKIAHEIKNATVDIWTGKSDHTLRRLTVNLDVPVSGKMATTLGGLQSAAITIEIQYADLNQAQTISAPANVAPYSQFTVKLRSIVSGALGGLGAGALGSLGGSSSSGSGGSANVSKYSQCIQKAGGDVTKMQKCSSLLNGG